MNKRTTQKTLYTPQVPSLVTVVLNNHSMFIIAMLKCKKRFYNIIWYIIFFMMADMSRTNNAVSNANTTTEGYIDHINQTESTSSFTTTIAIVICTGATIMVTILFIFVKGKFRNTSQNFKGIVNRPVL